MPVGITTIGNEGKRSSATFVVAASDSLHKERADYVCDGVDDQIQIQAAIDAINALGGGKILLLEGTFNTSAQIHLKSNVYLSGLGRGTIISANSVSYVIYVDSSTNIAIEDIYIVGNTTSGYGFFFDVSVTDFRISNVRIDDTNAGILLEHSHNGIVENCYVKSKAGATEPGYNPSADSSYITFRDCYGENNYTSFEIDDRVTDVSFIGCKSKNSVHYGVDIHNHVLEERCKRISFNDCRFINPAGRGLYLISVEDISIINCVIESSGADDGIYANYVESLLIENTVVRDATGYGVRWLNTSFARMNNCYIEGSTSWGMYVIGGQITNTEVNGCSAGWWLVSYVYLSNCKAVGTISNHGFYFTNNCSFINCDSRSNDADGFHSYSGDYARIIGCYSRSNGGAGIKGTGTSSRMHIEGCRISGNTGPGILVSEGGGYNIIIRNNAIGAGGWASEIYPHTNDIIYNYHTDIFMDVLAASANYIVNAQNILNGAVALTGTQPKYPRGLDCTITEVGGNVTEYTMTVVGTNAKGKTITDVFTFADDGLTFSSDNAFDHVTSVTLADVADTGNATFVMGIDKRLGLENIIYRTFKIIKNGTKQTVVAGDVDTDYDTYDMTTIGLAATDDFTIWYKSNLNIVS